MKKIHLLLLFLRKKLVITYLLIANFIIFSGIGNYFYDVSTAKQGFGFLSLLIGFLTTLIVLTVLIKW